MMNRQEGFTLIELMVVLSIIMMLLSFLTPSIFEQYKFAQIRGAVEQGHQILNTCELARQKATIAVRNSVTLQVTTSFHGEVTDWTSVTQLDALLDGDHYLPVMSPFNTPYLFKMQERFCTVGVQVDEALDGWEGYETSPLAGGHTLIQVSTPYAKPVTTDWVQFQKRTLSGETSR